MSLHVVDEIAEETAKLRIDTLEVAGAWGALVVGGGAACVEAFGVVSYAVLQGAPRQMNCLDVWKGGKTYRKMKTSKSYVCDRHSQICSS